MLYYAQASVPLLLIMAVFWQRGILSTQVFLLLWPAMYQYLHDLDVALVAELVEMEEGAHDQLVGRVGANFRWREYSWLALLEKSVRTLCIMTTQLFWFIDAQSECALAVRDR